MTDHTTADTWDARETVTPGAFTWSDVQGHVAWPGVQLQIVCGAQQMLSMVTIAPGGAVPLHSHPHEQTGIWLEGEADFTIGDHVQRVRPGDSYVIPGGVPHSVQVLDQPARALDIFTPIREDYLQYRGR